ncbi:hypothetical protein R7503_003545 [Escherichia coli]|nr:hypothetical protein [Escherichia coli]ELQ8824495.1 hypothetical protein [Escherichia coli]ELT2216005.1 hypothetical protein [Escherichia coli]ELW2915756.1 hypothetical protein [Escherichia coli]
MTTVTTAQANKLYQVALFTAANRNRSMVNILTEQQDAPKAVSPDKYNQVNHLIPTRVLVKGGEITCKILK